MALDNPGNGSSRYDWHLESMTQDYKLGLLAALAIVEAHKPGGPPKAKMGIIDRELAQCIADERRGEQIAKEEIAKAIEALLNLK